MSHHTTSGTPLSNVDVSSLAETEQNRSASFRTEMMKEGVLRFLEGIGIDLKDANLTDTPEKVVQAWRDEFLAGYAMDPAVILRDIYPDTKSGPIIVSNLRFVSVCPHHLLPYAGVAHLAYLPSEGVVGLGQLSRLVNCLSRRLVLQETLTRQIPEALMAHLHCSGAASILVSHQTCLALRGARQDKNRCTTAAYLGEFESDTSLRTLLHGTMSQQQP